MDVHAISEYLVKCPVCLSETRFVAEEANPIFLACSGCDHVIVIHSDMMYTVSENFAYDLMKLYNIRPCGRVTEARMSEVAQSSISYRNINQLHDLLQRPMDVKEFLEEIE